MRHRSRGLTLVELLIATAVFAVVGVMVYGALFSVLDSREASERQAARLAAVQYAVLRLGDDLRQAVDRPVRAQVPSEGLPLLTPADGRRLLTLTRGGRPNPAGQRRSSLARVHWSLDGEQRLLRAAQAHADVLPGTPPRPRVVLEDVETVELRFLGASGRWQTRWPSAEAGVTATALPRAVEVTLELSDWGRIVRLIPLTGAAPAAGGEGA